MRKLMQKYAQYLTAFSLVIALGGGVALAPVVSAEGGTGTSSGSGSGSGDSSGSGSAGTSSDDTKTTTTTTETAKTDAAKAAADAAREAAKEAAAKARDAAQASREAANTKLADAKLKSCQNREKAINNIFQRVSTRGAKQLEVFSTIATRTEEFYTKSGKTLPTYATLKAAADAKKTAAQAAVDAVKASSVTFKCDGTDPKGAAQSFKDKSKAMITALQDYKKAVKDLVVGVRSVQTDLTTDDKGGAQ